MNKLKNWLKIKLKKFLDVEELENKVNKETQYFQTKIDSHYGYFCKWNKNNEDSINAIHNTLENVINIGTDVHYNKSGRSWAVICIEGKMNIVKFVDLDRKDAREILDFLKCFEAGRHCIDTPYKEMFYNGLFKF